MADTAANCSTDDAASLRPKAGLAEEKAATEGGKPGPKPKSLGRSAATPITLAAEAATP